MLCVKCNETIEDDFIFCPWCGKKQTETKRKNTRRPNGDGTIYKLSDRRKKPWVAAIRKQMIGTYETRALAKQALDNVLQNGLPDGFNDTVLDVYERWKGKHFRNLTESGQQGYLIAWKRLEPIQGRKMRELKANDFQKIIDKAMVKQRKEGEGDKPLSRAGKEKIKQLCSQLCQQAMQDDIINKNYALFVALDKEEKQEKEVFTSDDIEKLFICESNTARVILTLIYTGFRINELFSLKCEDVYLEQGYMVGGEKTEAGRNRTVPIHEKIRPFITEWYNPYKEYLLRNTKGNKLDAKNFRDREYYPLLERLGISRKSPHSTRHTFASMAAASGMGKEALQKIIGHANYATTANIYVHNDIETLKNEMNKI